MRRIEASGPARPPGILRDEALDPRYARFARPVTTLDALNPLIGQALRQRLEPDEQIGQIIFAPRQPLIRQPQHDLWVWLTQWLVWDTTPDWVVVATDRQVHVATITDPSLVPVVTSTPLIDLLTLEIGTILLQSWVEWTWAREGRLARTRVAFNSVGLKLFRRMVGTMRAGLRPPGLLYSSHAAAAADPLAHLPFKFRNLLAHDLLLPQEHIRAAVYQPEFGYGVFGAKAPARALAATTEGWTLVEEDRPESVVRWGLITRFCPGARIHSAHVEKGARAEVWLCVQLTAGGARETWRVPFEGRAEAALQALLAR